MEDKNVKERINFLELQLVYHSKLYYIQEKPIISDFEYDLFFQELDELEQMYPEFKSNVSPTVRVGVSPNTKFEKYTREIPMLSLGNAFDDTDIDKFLTRVKKSLGIIPEFIMEKKYDGISLELVYKDGKLDLASTRGDGLMGEIVTDNAKTIKNIPLEIPNHAKTIIRGEVVIYKKDFESVNEDRIKEGKEPFSNPRNAASGSLRQLKSKVTAKRKLVFLAYDLKSDINVKSQLYSLKLLGNMGFTIGEVKTGNTRENLIETYHKLIDERESLEFEIDGMVIKVNDFTKQEKIGFRSRSPKWAIAWKLPAKEMSTKLLDVVWQVGKTGIVTPVGILDPVTIDGVVVSKATLHNKLEIQRKDLKINDYVFVCRSGDVIPKITKSIKEKRTGYEINIWIPVFCPSCNSRLKYADTFIKCVNDDCKAKLHGKIKHFVSKNALNIDGFGDKIVQKLVETKTIDSYVDIFTLTHEALMQIDRMGEKLATKILKNIHKAKNTTLSRFLYSLNIPHCGRTLSKILAEKFKTIGSLYYIDEKYLDSIDGIGYIMSNDISVFFYDDENIGMIDELLIYIELEEIKEKNVMESTIEGKLFCITGKLTEKRDYFVDFIEERCGIIKSGVVKKLDYLICGENSGSKLVKAEKLGIRVLTEDEFFNEIVGSK